MRLTYFTSGPTDHVLRAVVAAGHAVETVVVSDPERSPRVTPVVLLAEHLGLTLRVITRSRVADLAPYMKGRVGLSVGFAYLFPSSVIKEAALILNVHGAPLPKYAGLRTLNWLIENGETTSEVVVHQVDIGVDTGPILVRHAFPLSRFDTPASLLRKTLESQPAAVLEALTLVEEGRANFDVQTKVSERLPNRLPKHSELDPQLPLIELYDKIRAADPDRYPAYFFVDGQKVCIRMWRPDKPPAEADLL